MYDERSTFMAASWIRTTTDVFGEHTMPAGDAAAVTLSDIVGLGSTTAGPSLRSRWQRKLLTGLWIRASGLCQELDCAGVEIVHGAHDGDASLLRQVFKDRAAAVDLGDRQPDVCFRDRIHVGVVFA